MPLAGNSGKWFLPLSMTDTFAIKDFLLVTQPTNASGIYDKVGQKA